MTLGRPFLRLVAAVLLTLVAAGAAAADAAGAGRVEGAAVEAATRQLLVTGWAAPARPGVFTTNIVIRLGAREIYRGRFEHGERPDVVAATGRPEWLASGFGARVDIPRGVSGSQPLAVRMRTGDGAEFDLDVAPAIRQVQVPAPPPRPRAFAILLLVLATLFPVAAWAGWLRRRRRDDPVGIDDPARGRAGFAGAVVAAFVLLVAGGWTGSSIELLRDARGVAEHDALPWAGPARWVRSDEWQAFTPLAIAQARHAPAFPVVNRNLGPDGQNMLVMGMTGMPVAHLSALAKPATWGFFLFDLRRALAWSWWFPLFAGFLALWAVLQAFLGVRWRPAAVLALTLAAAPYTVVYSGWPAYAMFFPLLALLAAQRALQAPGWRMPLAAGAVAGLAGAGFALVLYPAWLISLAWLLAPFGIAWAAAHRRTLRWGAPQLGAAAVGLVVLLAVLGAWWADAHDAVQAMRATVYPGQRGAEAGGDIDRWFLLKGWLAPVTMYRDGSSLMGGASDAGSIVLLVVPALAAALWRWRAQRRIDAVAMALCAWLVIALWFLFVGFPPAFAHATGWGSTTTYRYDLALGLAQVLLLGWLLGRDGGDAPAPPVPAGLVAVAVALHGAWLATLVPPQIAELLVPPAVLLAVLSLGAAAWFLMRGRTLAAIALYAAWMLAATVPFNPLGLAPRQVQAAPAIAALATPGRPVLVLRERNASLLLPAAGVPVVNSLFYLPPAGLWQRLDPAGAQRAVHNRYQRLIVVPRALPAGETFRIESPRLDEVVLGIDPQRFDFRLAGAAFVLANADDAKLLAGHPGLRAAAVGTGWALYEVAR